MTPRRKKPAPGWFARAAEGIDLTKVALAVIGVLGSGSGLQCARLEGQRAEAAIAYGQSAEAGSDLCVDERDSLRLVVAAKDRKIERLSRELRRYRNRGVPGRAGSVEGSGDRESTATRTPALKNEGLTQGVVAAVSAPVRWLKALFVVKS